jgi:tryptophan synthase alpha chain
MNTVNQIIKKSDGDICSLFFTAGFPELSDTREILMSLDQENVDFIEVGMPYSDPMADGPTIQYSSQVSSKWNESRSSLRSIGGDKGSN